MLTNPSAVHTVEFRGVQALYDLAPGDRTAQMLGFTMCSATVSVYSRPEELSPRESSCVMLRSLGLPRATIAQTMGLSTDTVITHLNRSYRNLGVTGMSALPHYLLAKDHFRIDQYGDPLYISPAERRVIQTGISGATNAQIAQQLGLSPPTVRHHWANAAARNQANNREVLIMRELLSGVMVEVD
ncbi:MAG: LuxR C-terminal-related transcriptional regulator [Candidatus Saccharimonadales bacterium]